MFLQQKENSYANQTMLCYGFLKYFFQKKKTRKFRQFHNNVWLNVSLTLDRVVLDGASSVVPELVP